MTLYGKLCQGIELVPPVLADRIAMKAIHGGKIVMLLNKFPLP